MRDIFINLNTNKKVLVIGIFVLILIATGAYVASRPQQINPGQGFVKPESATISVNNKSVNNFYKDEVFTYPDGNVVIEETDDFQIAFNANEELFIITIFSSLKNENALPLAESALLQKLGVDQTTACTLKVDVQTYDNLNLDGQPQVSKLSFCK